jgi:hypothetical protein
LYDPVDSGNSDVFNVAGGFDRRWFWIYAPVAAIACQFRLMASLELLTIVEADARVASIWVKEESMKIKCHSSVSRGSRAAQLHR